MISRCQKYVAKIGGCDCCQYVLYVKQKEQPEDNVFFDTLLYFDRKEWYIWKENCRQENFTDILKEMYIR